MSLSVTAVSPQAPAQATEPVAAVKRDHRQDQPPLNHAPARDFSGFKDFMKTQGKGSRIDTIA